MGPLAVWVGEIHPCRPRHPKGIPLVNGDDPYGDVLVGGRTIQQQGVVRAPWARLADGGELGLELPHDGKADRALPSLPKGKERPPMRDARRGGQRPVSPRTVG